MMLPLLEVILALILLIGGLRFVRRMLFRRKKPAVPVDRCRCGYLLENLSIARCPECGKVIGFNSTAEELGLTDEELQRMQAVRLRRKNEADP